MAYGDFKYLPRRIAADKVLYHKEFIFARYSQFFLIKIIQVVVVIVELCQTKNYRN